MKKAQSGRTADVVGYQSILTYGLYREDINQIIDEELEKLNPEDSDFDFSYLAMKVFALGVIAGIREERSRRKGEGRA